MIENCIKMQFTVFKDDKRRLEKESRKLKAES